MNLNRANSAFTLIEMLVTVSLLTLLMGLAVVNYKQLFLSSKLSAAAQGLGDHFALAVSKSYTTGKANTLMFDLTAGRYWIHEGSGEDTEGKDLLERSLGKGVKFADVQVGYEMYQPPGTLSIEVSPLGVTSDFVVNLEDESGRAYAVSMNALTQSVKYYDGYAEYAETQDAPAE
jgi:prepilin-type N-terminal cleavage/methylation domain-containing protein